MVAGGLARRGSNNFEWRALLRRTCRAFSPGRRSLCLSSRELRTSNSIPVWLDVPAGHGSRSDCFIGHRPRRILRLHRPLAAAFDQTGGCRSHMGTLPVEHSQHSIQCRIHTLDYLAQTGPSRLSDGVGFCLSSGIVVKLRSLCRAAARFFAIGTRAWSRSRWRILFFWRLVGCRQDRRRGTRSGSHTSRAHCCSACLP